ncbi:MAG TPA: glycosyltransferase [Solirubrobacterales bacterium]|nr:glycosyltransferase [Solirubrobacterales bacterium]
MAGSNDARPPVSVIVPFRGDGAAAARTLATLARLDVGPGGEVVIADNSDHAVLATAPAPAAPIAVVRAGLERSAYHARNVAARRARGEWLLFCDADCVPEPGLLDAYFEAPIGERCGALAGEIVADQRQSALLARYSRDRRFLSQTGGIHGREGGAAATANLLVRRAAFEAVGGFAEGIRSGGDIDLCWRIAAAGWTLEHRPAARVVHRHRESLAGFVAQVARYGAGARWLDARHPGSSPRWPLAAGLAGSVRDIAAHLRRGRIEPALYRAIDGLGLIAHNVGYLGSNRAPRL